MFCKETQTLSQIFPQSQASGLNLEEEIGSEYQFLGLSVNLSNSNIRLSNGIICNVIKYLLF